MTDRLSPARIAEIRAQAEAERRERAEGNGKVDCIPPPEPDEPHVGEDFSEDTDEEPRERYGDVAALLAGTLPEPPRPVLLQRVDGHCLFYAGEVNTIFGDSETGKTFIALAASTEALRDGRRVMFVDLDHNGMEAIVARLLTLGAPAHRLGDLDTFRYFEPDDGADMIEEVTNAEQWRPAVVVVDSIGELCPMLGASSDSADDYTRVNSRVLQPLAKFGAVVIGIDHLAKSRASSAVGPGGSMAKRRALGGLSLRVKGHFAPDRGGSAHLSVNKDRHGGVRRHCPPPPTGQREQPAGTFVLERADDNGAVSWRIAAPLMTVDPEDTKDDHLAAVEELLEIGDYVTVDGLAKKVAGEEAITKGQRELSRYYLGEFTKAGHLEVAETGHRGGGKNRVPTRWRHPSEKQTKQATLDE